MNISVKGKAPSDSRLLVSDTAVDEAMDEMRPNSNTKYSKRQAKAASILRNFSSTAGNFLPGEQEIISKSIIMSQSIAYHSVKESVANKEIEKAKDSALAVMTCLCLTSLGAKIAYSSVATIFPPTMIHHNLSDFYTSVVIAFYAVS